MNRFARMSSPKRVSSGALKLLLLLAGCILAVLPATGRQQDFTSLATERLRLALETGSYTDLKSLGAPATSPVGDDFFERYSDFEFSNHRAYALQQFAFMRGRGYVTGVFFRREVEPRAYRWILVDAFQGPDRRLNLDEVTAAVDRARNAGDTFDGFDPLAHDARFLDFSIAVNAGNERLRAFLEAHGITDLQRANLAPLDHHSFYVIDEVGAHEQGKGPVSLRFVWAFLPSREGRIASGWYLRDVRAGSTVLAAGTQAGQRTEPGNARTEGRELAQGDKTESPCCSEMERVQGQWEVERALRKEAEAEKEKLMANLTGLRRDQERAETERQAVLERIDSLEAVNRRLVSEKMASLEQAQAAAKKSTLAAGMYSLLPGGGQFYKGNFRRGVTYAALITTSFALVTLTQRGVDGADELFKLRRAKVQQINATLRTCSGCTQRDRAALIAQRDRLIVKRDAAKATRSDRRFWRNLSLAAGVGAVGASIIDSIELDRKIGAWIFGRSYLASGTHHRIAFPTIYLDPRSGAASVHLRIGLR